MTDSPIQSAGLTTKELRRSALMMLGGSVVAGSIACWSAEGKLPGVITGVVFAIVAISGILHPRLMRPVHRVVTMVFRPVTWLLTIVVLTAVYFLIVTPIGLTRRVLRKSNMSDGGWIAVDQKPDSAQHVRPW